MSQSPPRHHRLWTSSSSSSSDDTFTLTSYNILAQSLIQPSFYPYTPPHLLSWPSRFHRISEELNDLDADIVCLQECEDGVGGDFRGVLNQSDLISVNEDSKEGNDSGGVSKSGSGSEKYTCEYVKRTGDKEDGCAIFVKSSRFNVVKVEKVEMNVNNVLNRDNVGLILLLQSTTTNRFVMVATTHVLFNPKRGYIKLAQVHRMLKCMEEMYRSFFGTSDMKDDDGIAVVFCGDFNMAPHCAIYEYITSGWIDPTDVPEPCMSGLIKKDEMERKCRTYRKSPIPLDSFQKLFQTTTSSASTSIPTSSSSQLQSVDLGTNQTLTHPFHLTSAYTHIDPPSGLPESTTYMGAATKSHPFFLDIISDRLKAEGKEGISEEVKANVRGHCVDFVFFGSVFGDGGGENRYHIGKEDKDNNESSGGDGKERMEKREKVVVERYLRVPVGDEFRKMPNERDPSDHVSLTVEFRLCD